MCSNFQPIKYDSSSWVKDNFGCNLPSTEWRSEVFPTYSAPFILLDEGKPKCDLAQFGLVPHWAKDNKKFGLKTYNARSETVHEKPSYRLAWRERRFGLVLVNYFYEPCYESGKAIRTPIYRADGEPTAIASIWDRFTDQDTGEVVTSFSMLTINADNHSLMKRFHKPDDEKRSVVVIRNSDFQTWLNASQEQAKALIGHSPDGYLKADFYKDPNALF